MALVRPPLQLPVEYVIPPDMELGFADTVMVQFTGHVFVLSMFQTPLPIYGDQAAADAAAAAGGSSAARCVARHVIPMGQAEQLATTLREILTQIQADIAAKDEEAKGTK